MATRPQGVPVHQASMSSNESPAGKMSLPMLPYSLREHKRGLAIAVCTVVGSSVFVNLGLFYGLWFGTTMAKNIVVAIPAAIFGVATVPPFFIRAFKLARKSPESRPIGGPRFAFDFFQWGYFFGVIMITVEIVIGTIPKYPVVRLLAMPASSLMLELATLVTISLILYFPGLKAPVRFSSVARGQYVRPGIYTIIEDVVGCDGGGGLVYREALNARYEASPDFRKLLRNMAVFWVVGFYLTAAVTIAIIFTVPEEVSYGCGWGIPFLVAALMALFTTKYVQKSLAQEKASWAGRVASA